MKKLIPLSLVAVALTLSAAEVQLDTIGVESTYISEVAKNAETSADVAEALNSRIPSIDMNRRSGIANDIHIRGQKRDNISVEVDGTKVHGACPNRMDPPTSHIVANQIAEVEVIEGPYDVETFGTLSGAVKITTKKPAKGFQGQVDLGLGSFGYKKLGVSANGGNEKIRMSVTASTEESGQYKDGDGNTLAEQAEGSVSGPANTSYQASNKDVDAYKKKSIMAKAFINVTDNQELRLSYTGNRSDDILYPNTPMDAAYDDSNIYNIGYSINNISNTFKKLDIQYYKSDVEHPMDTSLRMSGTASVMTNALTTEMEGLKLKNIFDLSGHTLTLGLDGSKRTWDGKYTNTDTSHAAHNIKSIDNAVTINKAVFAKLENSYGKYDIKIGARYDSTKVTNDGGLQDNKYSGFNANILTTYNYNENSKVFLGIGQAYRVPDGRELYFRSSMGLTLIGSPDLEQTKNRQIDLGYESNLETLSYKIKAFYSDLDNYIYFRNSGANRFENIDAKIYGAEFDAEYYASDALTLDASVAYKKGKKDQALDTQDDKDLADIAPLRGTVGATYEYAKNSSLRAEIVASKAWDNIDADNGEQEIAGWSVVNLKAKHAFGKSVDLTLGANNLFDRTYTQSNTYADLTLVASGGTTMLLNEPGRYLYTNLTYKF